MNEFDTKMLNGLKYRCARLSLQALLGFVLAMVALFNAGPAFAEITGSWSTSGSSGSAPVLGITVTQSGTLDGTAYTNQNFNTGSYWTNPYPGGSPSGGPGLWFTTPADPDATRTVTVTFSKPVDNPVLHINKLGGFGQPRGQIARSNTSVWTLAGSSSQGGSVSFSRLSGNPGFQVIGNSFRREPYVENVQNTADCRTDNLGTACGSVQINGTGITSLTFTVTSDGQGGPSGNIPDARLDGLSMRWSFVGSAVTVKKKSVGTTGVYSFQGTNGVASSFSLDTTAANPATSARYPIQDHTQAVKITETVPAGQSVSASCIDASGQTISSTLSGGSLSIASSSYDGNDDITCTFTNMVPPKMEVTKTAGQVVDANGNGKTDAGDTIDYTISVKNTGTVTISDLKVDDAKLGVSGVALNPSTLDPGQTGTAGPFTYTLTQADIDAGKVDNTATAKGKDPAGGDISGDASVSTPVAGTSAITLKKTAGAIQDANGDGKVNAGDTITYTFEVENTGGVTLSNVTIDDTKLGLSGAAVTPGTLAPGAKGTASKTYTLTQADIDAGKVDNTASTNGKTPSGGNVTASDTVTTPVSAAPEITLKKTAGAIQDANGDGKVNAGDTITYTFEVENTGTVTINNVTIDDAKLGLSGAAVTPSTLAPGAKGTASKTYTLTQADIDAGKVDNTATAKGKDPGGQEVSAIDTVTTPVSAAPEITLKKTAGAIQDTNGDGKVNAGDTITYTFEVENTGTVTINNVTIDDAKLGLAGAAVTPSTLAPGAKGTASKTYTLTQADIDAGKVDNTATAKGKEPAGQEVSAIDTVTTPVAGAAAISLKKTAGAIQDANGDGKVSAGDTITYTFEVENTGTVTVDNVTISDTKLGLSGAPVTPGTLAPGQKGTASATYTLTQADIDAGKVDNTATAKGKDPSGQDVNADASVSTPVAGTSAITLKKTAGAVQDANGDGKVNAGDTITYTFEVENTGTVTINNVTIDDAKLGLSGAAVTPSTLAPGAKGTASATYTLTQADIDAGKVDNTATAKGKDPSGQDVNADASVSTPIAATPSITLKKTAGAIQDANGDGKVNAGDTITYTFEVENTGTVTIDNVTVSDAKLGLSNIAVTPGTLAPGAKGTASATYTLTQADIDAGKVDNTATAKGKDPSGKDVSADASVSTPVAGTSAITLKKTAGAVQDANGDGKVSAGDTIIYTFEVENTGTVTVDNVTISDTKLGLSGAAVTPSTLAPGQKGTASATYTLTQADIDAGKVDNTATAKGKDPSGQDVNADASVSTPVAGTSAITLKKTAGAVQDANSDGKVNAGDTITYTFEVENTGTVTIDNVTVSDSKLGLSNIAVNPSTLAPGARGTASATYTLTQADIDAGKVDNTATAKGKDPSGQDVSADARVSTPVAGTSAITLKKTAGAIQDANSDGKVNAGDTITYTFEVENTGTVTIDNVTVSDAKLGLSNIAVNPSTLAPGAKGTASATYTLTQADIDAGKVDNTATAKGKDPSGKDVNADASVSTPVAATSAISLKKTAGAIQDANGDGKVNAGDTITYTFEVENTGAVTLSNVTIDDAKLGLSGAAVTPGTLAPGQKGTASATYTLTQADIDAGKVDNTATAKGKDPSGKDVSATDTVTAPIQAAPQITLIKTAGAIQDANGDGKVNAGDTITYTFEVENTGSVTLSNVTIDDAKLGLSGAAVTPGTLAPGAKGTASKTYTLTQADVDAGKVDNTATAKGKDPAGKEVSASDTVTTPVTGTPAISLKKTAGAIQDANGDGKVSAGDTITYTFEVENTGGVTLSNVTVDDTKLGLSGAAVTPGTLAPGAKGTASATYTLTQADIDAGKVDNTASTNGKTPSGGNVTASDTITTPVAGTPAITLKKTAGAIQDANGDGKVNAGDTVTYTFEVENTGSVTLSNVTIDDAKLGLSGAAVTPSTLAPGAKGTASKTYTLTQADIDAGKVDNTATAKGKDPAGKEVSADASVSTPVAGTPAITLKKTAGAVQDANGDGKVNAGDTITYTFEVENTGTVTIDNVTVSDAKLGLNNIAVNPGTLAPGAKGTATATYTLTQADIDAGKVDNTATAKGKDPSGKDVDADASVSTPVAGAPAISLKKTAGAIQDANGDGKVNAGDTITYSFEVENTGSVTLSNVTVDDAKLGLSGAAVTPGTLAPGQKGTASATYTLTQADIDAGKVDNTATAKGKDPAGKEVSASDTVTTPVAGTPAISLKKTAGAIQDANGDGKVSAGDTITYTFEVENTGGVTLSNVTVDDAKLGLSGSAVTPGTLAPGAKGTASATYTLTQADIDAGKVDNTATAKGKDPAGKEVSASDTVTTPVTRAPSLTIEKKAGAPSGSTVGSTIDYTFTVTNTGNVTLTNVTVEDTLAGIVVSGGPLAELKPGAVDSTTFKARYTLTQEDLDKGEVKNTASASGTPPGGGDPVTSPPSEVTTRLEAKPALTLEKKAGAPSGSTVGSTIDYTFTLTNTGNVTLTNVTVEDALPGIVVSGGPLAELKPGAVDSATFKARYTLTQEDLDKGEVKNTATASGSPPGGGDPVTSPPSEVTTKLEAKPALTVEKKAGKPSGSTVGSTIDYTFTITNTGNVTLTNVTVRDTLPGIVISGGPLAELKPGAVDSTTFKARYTLTQADLDKGEVKNAATASGTPPNGGDPVTSPPSEVTTKLEAKPALTVEKKAGKPSGSAVGSTIDYTFTITNTGNITIEDISLADTLPGIVISGGPIAELAPGQKDTITFTARYSLTQADIDAGRVDNSATVTGTPANGGNPVTSPPSQVSTPIEQMPKIALAKTAKVNDVNGNGFIEAGDTITYTFTVTNTGNVRVDDVLPIDAGPTFNGRPAGGRLGPFTPGATSIEPGDKVVFAASYTLTQEDVDNAAGVTNGVANTATARGYHRSNGANTVVDAPPARATVGLPAAAPSDVTITKQAGLRMIRRGEKAPFILKVTNKTNANIAGLNVVDRMPSGFRYVDGSASIDGVPATPVVNGLNVLFQNIKLGPRAEVVIRLQMLALSSAGPGKHVNRAAVTGPAGNVLAEASAAIEIMIEPVFDCGDVIGKVFDDENRNGYQDEGEPGLPGVRVATVQGLLITTDKFGRFHVACADLPDARIGTNFIMKLDTRTLPTGYRLTTENPRVIRLTAGKMSKLNFGAALGRVVRLDLKDEAFAPGGVELKPQWGKGIDQLIEVLRKEQSILRISYLSSNQDLATKRADAVEDEIARRWRAIGNLYELKIESRIQSRNP